MAQKKRILVIDDNASDLELTARYLRKAGHCAVCCSNGRDALAWLAKHELPAAVLSDRRMNGGMSGDEFARHFRALTGGEYIPLIALTGYMTASNMKRAQAAGFDGVIEKTASAEIFAQQLRAFVR